MADKTATIALFDLVACAIAIGGYVVGALSGAVALALLGAVAVLNVVWFVGVVGGGARDEWRS